jgi:hypothetical protein
MKQVLAPVALAAAFLAAGAAQATVTPYNTQAAFVTAVSTPVGVDTYNDLDFTQPMATPTSRAAGSFTYLASAGPLNNFFPSANTAADVWLSAADRTDTITFSSFSGGVNAIGGFFFRTDVQGFTTTTPADITVRVTDASGTSTFSLSNPTTTSFLGFISDSTITSMQVFVGVQGTGTQAVWASINDLTLGVAPVPEPGTYAMLLAGLGLVGFMARRRQA